ncbi:MAG: dual specificity protein phosphatase family protein [Actinobacteria bacterium]|nr:dual specificity protein phosphatase family protein [Actinomycetota bacterium]
MGVTLVVDLVPGRGDDPAFLRDLGIEHLWLPLTDGHIPDAETVRRFLEAVESSRGAVYVHCGAGVGRSSSLAAAYLASVGRDPSLVEALAVGPPTLEQAWFIWSAEPGRPAGGNGWVTALSRFLDSPRTGFDILKDLF